MADARPGIPVLPLDELRMAGAADQFPQLEGVLRQSLSYLVAWAGDRNDPKSLYPVLVQATADGKLQVEGIGGSVSTFPDFTGNGSPEGVITAGAGKFYTDTDMGALYIKASGSDNTGWALAGGNASALQAGTIHGTGIDGNNALIVAGPGSFAALTDMVGQAGTGNSAYFQGTGVDGTQGFVVQLGSTGQYTWQFASDGRTNIPGPVDQGGDTNYATADTGPVIADQSDGHTYRIISTAGVLSTELVT